MSPAGAVGCLLALIAFSAQAQNRGDCQWRVAEGWSALVAPLDEPGERMVVSGQVLAADARTPLAGVTVLVFQTDNQGYYSPKGMDESDARLCGLMLTDAQGRYQFESIKPAHYATGGSPPAHIHYRVWGPDTPRQSFTLHFEGDPLLGARGRDASENPTWATVRPVEADSDGTLLVKRDLLVR